MNSLVRQQASSSVAHWSGPQERGWWTNKQEVMTDNRSQSYLSGNYGTLLRGNKMLSFFLKDWESSAKSEPAVRLDPRCESETRHPARWFAQASVKSKIIPFVTSGRLRASSGRHLMAQLSTSAPASCYLWLIYLKAQHRFGLQT